MTVTLEETALGHLGDVPCGMGNMSVTTYELPDGSTREGQTATLFPGDDGFVVVGLGSVLEVGDARWEVIAIAKERGEPGTVTLREVGTGDGAAADPRDALDLRYNARCERCGTIAGWTGQTEDQWGDKLMLMRCPGCANEFGWFDGALAGPLAQGLLPFVAGRRS